MNKSKIEWTQRTWNPWIGCSRVSTGCDNCYAIDASMAQARNQSTKVATRTAYRQVVAMRANGRSDFSGTLVQFPERLKQPYAWQPSTVFVNSMSDMFHPNMAMTDIHAMFDVMEETDKHTYQILTKRPDNIGKYITWTTGDGPTQNRGGKGWTSGICPVGTTFADNIWIGTTVENREVAEKRIPHLLNVPAQVRFLSVEPMLEAIDLTPWLKNIQWIICGGESGSRARPMHPDWVEGLRDQCKWAKVPFFFKQWGHHKPVFSLPDALCMHGPRWEDLSEKNSPYYNDYQAHSYNGQGGMWRYISPGKSKAGRELDGEFYNEAPYLIPGMTNFTTPY